MIDFHVHIGELYRHDYPNKVGLSAHQLVARMDREGIEISVLLPLESPEGAYGYFLTEQAVEARNMYPERLIAFACIDPRMSQAPQQIDTFVKHYGCKGFGEHINELAFDDERNKAIYAKCDEHGLPLVFEINVNYCYDEVGLPRLEACLNEFPNVKFCGHGPSFWTAISGDDNGEGGYPRVPGFVCSNGRRAAGVFQTLYGHDNISRQQLVLVYSNCCRYCRNLQTLVYSQSATTSHSGPHQADAADTWAGYQEKRYSRVYAKHVVDVA